MTATQSAGETECGLVRVRAAARRDAKLRFNNLLHHITQERLNEAYHELNRKALSGVDNETWQTYGEQLHQRLRDLHNRIHQGRYRPQPSKRAWIPKAGGQRPIGIAALEDKIVQQAMVWVVQSIYEEDFLGFSYGFRPGRSPHQALDALYVAITQRKVSWVLDADVKGFFDSLDHAWLVKFISHRVADRRVLAMVEDLLKAGVIEEGHWTSTAAGTPQGAVLSPLLANIYLHYVLDLWVHQWRRRKATGELYIVRYCDDFVVGFQYQSDGIAFKKALEKRLARFGLHLHQGKTRLIEFGRFATTNRAKRGKRKPQTFNFLGFTHICARRRSDGKFTLRRHTIAQRQRRTQQRVKQRLMRRRCARVRTQGEWLRRVMLGFMNYYGVPGNIKSIDAFRTQICRAWRRALRRRGNKRPISWTRMQTHINRWIPSSRLVHPYPNQRLHV